MPRLGDVRAYPSGAGCDYTDGKDRIWTLNRGQTPAQVFSQSGERLMSWGADRDLFLGDIQGCRARRFRKLESDDDSFGASQGGLAGAPSKRDDAVRKAANP